MNVIILIVVGVIIADVLNQATQQPGQLSATSKIATSTWSSTVNALLGVGKKQ